MSPASRGPSEVEKYIGTDLISSRPRFCHHGNGGKGKRTEAAEAEGKVVFAKPDGGNEKFRRRYRPTPRVDAGAAFVVDRKNDFVGNGELGPHSRTPLSRLAVHARGAPLMLTGRCDRGRKNRNRGCRNDDFAPESPNKRSDKHKKEDSRGRGGTSDRLSVASDESSGSGHSENRLPRIIKPRKRRKKDRKPNVSAEESAPVPEEANAASADVSSENRPETDFSEEDFHGPRLDHSFEEVTESDAASYACSPSSCGCRYCDPSGIWDAPSGLPYSSHSDLVLRRSWSEPTRPFLPWKRGEEPSEESFSYLPRAGSVGEAELRGASRWESLEGCRIGAEPDPEPTVYDSRRLRVSTEIVTSPNGHRDIEIRFYSASSPAPSTELKR